MRTQVRHTSPLMNIRKARQEQEIAWSFRAGVAIDVKFGMAKYDCRFHGICRLDIDESDLNTPYNLKCGRGKGWLFIPRPDYCLICFNKASLTELTRWIHFQKKNFVLEEAVPLSEGLSGYFGWPLILKSGRYKVQERGNGYRVLFGLQGRKSGKINGL